MSWLVDNAKTLYVLLGLLAVAMVMVWRSNRQNRYLAYAAGALALMGIVYVLTLFYISDNKQLEMNVNAMADAVVAGKVDDLFKHVSKDFKWKGIGRDELYKSTQVAVKDHQVTQVNISSFRVEEVSRSKAFAKTSFLVTATAGNQIMFRTEADFVLEGEQWKLKTMRFFRPIGGQDQEIDLPGLR
jgi:hypothetical protein